MPEETAVELQAGDKLDTGRYTVIHKLGSGGFATVWLALQKRDPRYVAIKCTNEKSRLSLQEVKLLQKFKQSPYIVNMLSAFQLQGAKTVHQCITCELMANNVEEILHLLPKFDNSVSDHSPRKFPSYIAKKVTLDVLHAINALHAVGIVHADLTTYNILVAADIKSNFKPQPKGYLGSIPPKTGRDFYVKLSDLGCAFNAATPPPKLPTSKSLIPPEMLLGEPGKTGLDIWSFGMLVYYLFTTRVFIGIPMTKDQDDRVLLAIYYSLGPFHQSLLDLWAERTPYRLEWFNGYNQLLPDKLAIVKPSLQMEAFFERGRPDGMDDSEAVAICEFVRHCLTLDPRHRPTTKKLLQHPFIRDISTNWQNSITPKDR